MNRALLLVFAIFLLLFSHQVFAAGIGISPVTFEISGNPGEVIENNIKVFNPTDATVGVKMEVEDIAPTGEEGFVMVEPPETETYSLARWITAEPQEFDLAPGGEQFVKFTLIIPENAEPGGHYGTVLAGTKAIVGNGATGALLTQRVGALVLLTVPGLAKEELVVKEFKATSTYSEYGPIIFVAKFENLGSVHVKPTGYVTVTNWLGKKIGDVPIAPRNILPGGLRIFEMVLNKKWLWAGKYTATLSGSYGSQSLSFPSAVITFWAFPWKAGLGILLLVIFLILTRKRWLTAFKVIVGGEKAIKNRN